MADTAQTQGTGGGEGAQPQIPIANVTPESKPADTPKVDETKVEPMPAVPDTAIKTEDKLASPENAQTETEIKAGDDLASPENAQPETVHVEEIKSKENPVIVDHAPEQVLIQEILVAANANQIGKVPETNKEEVKTDLPASSGETAVTEANVKKDETPPQDSGDWQQREQELLKKIEELEKVKNERSEDGLRLELKIREEEIDLLKARVKSLETELQAALSKPGSKNQELIEKIKHQHEELLSKARGMIFDKTKVVKNQELQIEALTTQIQSLKDINQITKDLLEIRNSEVKAMEERLEVMEARFKGEKERYDLVLKRAQTSSNINDDLRKEYETQLAIFKELREKYELRVQALVSENNRLKESLQGGSS